MALTRTNQGLLLVVCGVAYLGGCLPDEMPAYTNGGKPVISGYSFRPFYAWTCVSRGRAQWQADSVLHFTNFSCEGRNINPKFTNATAARSPTRKPG